MGRPVLEFSLGVSNPVTGWAEAEPDTGSGGEGPLQRPVVTACFR
jgi:hypothetical protein